MDSVSVVAVLDAGLGDEAYLVDVGGGRALALDPSLDLRALDVEADRRGSWVAVAAEAHLHADFVSGATRLSRRDGARVVGAAARPDHISVRTAGPSDWATATGRTLDVDA